MAEEPSEREKSMMSITGRNAAYSLGLSIAVAFAFALAYTLMSLVGDTVDGKQSGIMTVLGRVVGFLQVTGICVGPVVFLISFALLQRLKIKY